ncbi:G-type lectin S-receptor-like serine/threonine-protein kinase LECRK3 [Coffea eugenioides]|uniref:G-type lectin S-receptor-like serine/threonine-protein kinase LECRK3 n=1 Tax=Coffea eugenioides TaxID=49369 RepID=UPI000F60C787|nr:G-type lectin S-receptor-like serine/threonine-protein kinase LECRK3 [Coffea eugenioides]
MAYVFLIHLTCFTLFCPFHILAQNSGLVSVGSILAANESSIPWLSPSGDFAFGFRQLQDKDMFLLSIWYDKIPDKTVAWYVGSLGNPVPRGSTVELQAKRGLVLRDPQGQDIWSSATIYDEVNYGFMNNTGNFIIMASNNYTRLWESFRFAVDTILPLQRLTYGSVLYSRQSETNFSRGRFSLRFHQDGNLLLRVGSVPILDANAVYYSSQTSDAVNPLNSGQFVMFDSKASMYIQMRNNQTMQLTPFGIPPVSENYHRATLDFDGAFTHYFHPRTFTGKPNWTAFWAIPENVCTAMDGTKGSGVCGYNSVCSLVGRKPVCECPQGYSLLDPNDKYGGCTPNFNQSCDELEQLPVEDKYDILAGSDIEWSNKSEYEVVNPSTEARCRKACLQDCLCAVAVLRNSSCWKKKLPLSNGRSVTNINSKVFLKYSKSDLPRQPHNLYPASARSKDRENLILVESVLLGTSLLLNIVIIGAICFGFQVIYQNNKLNLHPSKNGVEINLHCFSYKKLAEATNGFREELGRGSFGIVYKGEIKVGSIKDTVAVKKLDRVAQDAEKEFLAEVNTIGQTNHKHLVRLLGFCYEKQHRLLVYEYMGNGTLASLLFGKTIPSWKLRTQIATGIARGLVYLHDECSSQMIHCDIKPQNILLDDYYNARISDFGLAKLLQINQSRTLTNIRGTRGYVAPEWFRNTQITSKVDVYSFGVLLLEIICCRRHVEDADIGEGRNAILTDWAWDCFQERRLDALVENDFEVLEDRMELEKYVKIGIWCIQEDPSPRPTMRKVSHMLEGIVEVMIPPCPSPFFSTI